MIESRIGSECTMNDGEGDEQMAESTMVKKPAHVEPLQRLNQHVSLIHRASGASLDDEQNMRGNSGQQQQAASGEYETINTYR
jgi:hypothetical protein